MGGREHMFFIPHSTLNNQYLLIWIMFWKLNDPLLLQCYHPFISSFSDHFYQQLLYYLLSFLLQTSFWPLLSNLPKEDLNDFLMSIPKNLFCTSAFLISLEDMTSLILCSLSSQSSLLTPSSSIHPLNIGAPQGGVPSSALYSSHSQEISLASMVSKAIYKLTSKPLPVD